MFIITLEPLLAAFRRNVDIKGIRVGAGEHKVAAFAHDLLCYITCPRTTIPMALKEFERYGRLTNFKINMSKSELLNISIPKREQRAFLSGLSFAWCERELEYLGIKLLPTPGDLFAANYIPLLNKIKDLLGRMRYRALSWIGRINAIKMFVLPMVIYIFQMIPIATPPMFFVKLQSIILKFIWARRRPRIAYDILVKDKKQGGLGAPDFKKYYSIIQYYHCYL